MTERRRSGFLETETLRLLRDRADALSAQQMVEILREGGDDIPLSMMFRTLRRLVASGAVRKLHLAGGYVLAAVDSAIDLRCLSCGRVAAIPSSGTADDLRRMAERARFRVSRCIVEVPGLCHDCTTIPSNQRILRSLDKRIG